MVTASISLFKWTLTIKVHLILKRNKSKHFAIVNKPDMSKRTIQPLIPTEPPKKHENAKSSRMGDHDPSECFSSGWSSTMLKGKVLHV